MVFLILIREKKIKHTSGALILFMGAVYYNFRVEGMTGTLAILPEEIGSIIGVVNDSPELRVDKITV